VIHSPPGLIPSLHKLYLHTTFGVYITKWIKLGTAIAKLWPGPDSNRGHLPYPDDKLCKESGYEPFTTRSYSLLLQAVFMLHFLVST
jgi:hypothetical protein